MSSATLALRLLPRAGADRDARPALARLTIVELRKMVDTRAGFWLLLAIALLTVAAVALVAIFGETEDQRLRAMLAVAVAPSSILLPIVGILLVTSEWGQRTALITFSLVPRRERVFTAKLLAGTLLALVALLLGLIVAAIGTAIAAPGVDHTWTLPVGLLGQVAVYLVTGMLGGIGFGAVLLATAPAIVLSFALPIAWSILGSLSALEGAARWLDSTRSLEPMADHLMSTTEWARAATTLALWMLLPLVAGLWRIRRAEIR